MHAALKYALHRHMSKGKDLADAVDSVVGDQALQDKLFTAQDTIMRYAHSSVFVS